MMQRWVVAKSDGAYGEWEAIDRRTEEPEVRFAWLSRGAAQKRCDELNDQRSEDTGEAER
jgi:hypothetical protein